MVQLIAAREQLEVGFRVAYEDMANPRREGRVVEVIERGGETPSGLPLPSLTEYRVCWDDEGGETISDLRQHGWSQLAELPGSPFDGAEVIAAYTRAQALEDGVLVDVSETSEAREAGFVWPVALTRALYEFVDPNERERAVGQSFAGRLWDVLYLARTAIKTAGEGTSLEFGCIFWEDRGGRPRGRERALRLETGPGDEGEPVVTVGLPEDF